MAPRRDLLRWEARPSASPRLSPRAWGWLVAAAGEWAAETPSSGGCWAAQGL